MPHTFSVRILMRTLSHEIQVTRFKRKLKQHPSDLSILHFTVMRIEVRVRNLLTDPKH
jgi:hypothetical protein